MDSLPPLPPPPTPEDGFMLVSRRKWGAIQPSFVPSLNAAARIVMFGFPQQKYAPKGKPWLGPRPTFESTVSEIKFIQRMDLKKYPDIKYNFLIAPNGFVFEGRGWQNVPTLPSKFKNFSHISYYIMFIGDFTSGSPSEDCYETRDKLIQFGVKHKFISKKFLMYTMESNVNSPYEPCDFNEKKLNLTKY